MMRGSRTRALRALAVGACLMLGFAGLPATHAAAAGTCKVTYTKRTDWGTGFTLDVLIQNLGPAWTSWNLGYSYSGNQTLQNGWNGTWTQSGQNVTVTSLSWNANVATNGTVDIGANFNYTGTNTDPTVFSVNGATCGGVQAPTVTLTSPTAGQTFTAGSTVPLAATAAADPSTSITRVEFYNGATLLATSTTSPYTASWPNVPGGSYSVTAKAYDGLGNTATSAAAAITVSTTTSPSIVASTATLSLLQGTTGTFGVTLSAAPTSNVTVTVARVAGGDTGLSVTAGGTLTFTSGNFSTAQNVTIGADASSTGSATFTASATGYNPAGVMVTESAAGTHPANPYLGATQYLNPDYVTEVNAQVSADGGNAHEAKVGTWQTGIWMDRIAAIAGDSTHMGLQAHLDHALTTKQGSTPEVVEVVVYDLPGRDCAALASNGELPATTAGLTTYETQYIDPIVSILGNSKYSSLRISAIIEPDSLPNVVTNQSKPTCATATPFYEQGIEYALNHLHAITNVWNYVDIAHSAWLGWPNNMSGAGQEFAKVARATTAGFASIDGFISDTANYTPTTEPFLPNPTMNVGGQQLDSVNFYQFNPTFDEVTYDTMMHNTLLANGFPTAPFLIDTSRNGWGGTQRPTALNSSPTTAAAYVAANKVDQRGFRGNWCNQNNAGIGTPPTVQPFGASSPIIAFVWIKPPGESDGDYPTATHTHGDPHCDPNSTNTDGNGNTYPTGSIPGFDVPAGQWFPAEFQMLVRNSFPAL